jgi:hypothetical protein
MCLPKPSKWHLYDFSTVNNFDYRTTYNVITTTPVNFISYSPTDFVSTGSLPCALQVHSKAKEAECRAALQRLQLAMSVVEDVERRMGIAEQWTQENPKYHAAQEYLDNQNFICVVENLESLVVQWLFELSKANLAGTGMCFTRWMTSF